MTTFSQEAGESLVSAYLRNFTDDEPQTIPDCPSNAALGIFKEHLKRAQAAHVDVAGIFEAGAAFASEVSQATLTLPASKALQAVEACINKYGGWFQDMIQE